MPYLRFATERDDDEMTAATWNAGQKTPATHGRIVIDPLLRLGSIGNSKE
jgi:hypothetical protein